MLHPEPADCSPRSRRPPAGFAARRYSTVHCRVSICYAGRRRLNGIVFTAPRSRPSWPRATPVSKKRPPPLRSMVKAFCCWSWGARLDLCLIRDEPVDVNRPLTIEASTCRQRRVSPPDAVVSSYLSPAPGHPGPGFLEGSSCVKKSEWRQLPGGRQMESGMARIFDLSGCQAVSSATTRSRRLSALLVVTPTMARCWINKFAARKRPSRRQLAIARDICEGQRQLEIFVSGRRQGWRHGGLPVDGQAGS